MENTRTKDRLNALLKVSEVESWLSLMAAFNAIYQRLESALAVEQCSIPRFQILFNLYFGGGLPPIELSRRLLVTRGNISMFLKRLQTDGLIRQEKKTLSEKRSNYVLTAKGKALFEKVFPRHINRVRALMPALPGPQISVLRRIAASARSTALDS